MKDDFDLKKYKNFEDYAESLEGNRYIHSVYLKAVNHPVRREILKITNEKGTVSEKFLFMHLQKEGLINEINTLKYNLDYLRKAFCIERVKKNNDNLYQITKNGKVIDYLE